MQETETAPFHVDLVVVGGGLAGLFAANLVAQAGRTVVVLEQARVIGGRAVTRVQNGVHFNLGAHALYGGGHAARLLEELGVAFTGKNPDPGHGLVFLGETPYRLPRGIGSLVSSPLLTAREKWRFLRVLIDLPRLRVRRLDGISVREWVHRRVGEGNAARLLRALLRLSTYCDLHERLSAGVAIEQLRAALKHNVWYLDGGWQTLVDGLRARAVNRGALVRVGAGASSVRSDETGVVVQTTGGEILRSRAAVLAVAPATACDLLDLNADAPLVQWTKQLRPGPGRVPRRGTFEASGTRPAICPGP